MSACASAASPAHTARTAHAAFADRVAPSTDDDPPAYAPAPGSPAGDALAMSHGAAQARALALRFVRALLDGDAMTLQEIFAPEVVRLSASQSVERARIVSECLNTARQLRFAPELRPADVVRFEALELTGTANGEIDVYLPLRSVDAPRAFSSLPCVSRVVVRPGQEPRIVAVGR